MYYYHTENDATGLDESSLDWVSQEMRHKLASETSVPELPNWPMVQRRLCTEDWPWLVGLQQGCLPTGSIQHQCSVKSSLYIISLPLVAKSRALWLYMVSALNSSCSFVVIIHQRAFETQYREDTNCKEGMVSVTEVSGHKTIAFGVVYLHPNSNQTERRKIQDATAKWVKEI